MDVDDYGEVVVDDFSYDAVEFGHEGCAVGCGPAHSVNRIGVDAEADVVEAEFGHERDVVGVVKVLRYPTE